MPRLKQPNALVGIAATALISWGSGGLGQPAGAQPPTTPEATANGRASPDASPQIDTAAVALLQKVDSVRREPSRSLSAEFSSTTTSAGAKSRTMRGNIQLMAPALERIEQVVTTSDPTMASLSQTIVADGKAVWTLDNTAHKYASRPAAGTVRDVLFPAAELATVLFTGPAGPRDPFLMTPIDAARRDGRLHFLRDGSKEMWEGKSYDVVTFEIANPLPPAANASSGDRPTASMLTSRTTLYIGPDAIVYRRLQDIQMGKNRFGSEVALRNLHLGAPIAETAFAFTPPADASPDTPPQVLASGTVAPDFLVTATNGKPMHLSDYRGKVVVLDFWATWCGPCQRSFPHTNAVAKSLDANKAIVLAVDVWDTEPAYTAWLKTHTSEYASLHFAIDPSKQGKDIASAMYQVSGIPTQYVIDGNGKIVEALVGYEPGEKRLEAALAKAGLPAVQVASSSER